MTASAVLSVGATAQGAVLSSVAALALGGSALDGYPPVTDAASLTVTGPVSGSSAEAARGAVLAIGDQPDIFYSGNQPVFTVQPNPVQVDPIQPPSADWPGPNIEAPTNVSSPTNPAFVGNQPVNYEPPPIVKVNDVQPGSANWPAPPNYPLDPPPENPG